jgi:capsular polysaccharide biosynthesis protein
MSDPGELSISELRKKRGEASLGAPQPPDAFGPAPATVMTGPSPAPQTAGGGGGEDFELPVDPWRLLAALKRSWFWLFISGALFAVAGGLGGHYVADYNVKITLILRGASTPFVAGLEGESFKPQQLSVRTLVSLLQSPELARQVAGKAQPPVDEKQLLKRVSANQERDTDLLILRIVGKHKQDLVALVNLYADEAVKLTLDLQLRESTGMNEFYQRKLLAADSELKQVNDELLAFQSQAKLVDPETETKTYLGQLGDILSRLYTARIEREVVDLQVKELQKELARQTTEPSRLRAAREQLASLVSKYGEAHPQVQNARREIARLEQQATEVATNSISEAPKFAENSLASALYLRKVEMQTRKLTLEKELLEYETLKTNVQAKLTGLSKEALGYALIKARYDSLQKSRSLLDSRQREAQLYVGNAQGYFRVLAPATLGDVDSKSRVMKGGLLGGVGFVLGVLLAALVVLAREVLDDRIKTAADVERVTGLRVLTTLGDLKKMSPAEKEKWAFRAWTNLSSKLTVSADHGMVCGFISSTAGEGRTTWINLLVSAASQRGLRVLTVATRPSVPAAEGAEAANDAQERVFTREVDEALAKMNLPMQLASATLTSQVLAFPAEVTRKFKDPNAPPVAHIPLPGWVWNLERRKQWQSALMQWRSIESLVLLVELPPASVPEAVLLAENLPQLIWLVDSGKARARETREQLETLRHARCRLVGAVLNHEPAPALRF